MTHNGSIQTTHNNWVIPGQLMCGPFPGLDGINYPDEISTVNNLNGIMADGINTFICLQEEISVQDGTPGTLQESLRWAFPKFCNYSYFLQNATNIEYRHFPMKDQTTPNSTDFLLYINYILELLMRGRKVFIHCAGGHGRTGVYVAVLLALIYNITVEDALLRTQMYHNSRIENDKRQTHHVLSPSTREQKAFVRQMCEYFYN